MTALPEGIVGVIRAGEPEHAATIALGLDRAGVSAVEITLTVPNAVDVIRQLVAARRGGTITSVVGAGTVRSAEQCHASIDAGAAFIVSPGLLRPVVAAAVSHSIPAVPGALTPTEVMACLEAGASAVKLFPVSVMGGPRYVRTLSEALPGVTWMVSGGVGAEEVVGYQEAGVSMVCVGGALIDRDAARRGDVAGIAEHARSVLELMFRR